MKDLVTDRALLHLIHLLRAIDLGASRGVMIGYPPKEETLADSLAFTGIPRGHCLTRDLLCLFCFLLFSLIFLFIVQSTVVGALSFFPLCRAVTGLSQL